MKASTRFGSLALLAFVLGVGCEDGSDIVCTPGLTKVCAGPGACNGAQVCLPDGSQYGECDCGGQGAGTMVDGVWVPADAGGTWVDGGLVPLDGNGSSSSSTGGGSSSTGGGSSSTGGVGGGEVVSLAEDTECDMTGVWAVRKLTLPVLANVQPQSHWAYVEITQVGAEFTVGNSLDCGHRASGNADVVFGIDTQLGIIDKNPQRGRTGTFLRNADHCEFAIDRWYTRIGLPASVLDEYQGTTNALPPNVESMLGIAEDWDGDGYGGIAYLTSGIVSGKRHAIDIRWDEYYNDAGFGHMPPLNSTDFTLRMSYGVAEAVVFAEKNNGGESALLKGSAIVIANANNSLRFSLLGRTLAQAWAGDVVVQGNDLDTCYNIQDNFPHEDDRI